MVTPKYENTSSVQRAQDHPSFHRTTKSNVTRGSYSSTAMSMPQRSSHTITIASSSRDSPSSHPLTKAALDLAYTSYQQDNMEKVTRLQKAAKELGFELQADECLESDRSDLEGWLEAQSQLYHPLAAKEGPKKPCYGSRM